jgi:hypothetical protein
LENRGSPQLGVRVWAKGMEKPHFAVLCHTPPVGERGAFLEWAMLGSNQRPLPCEGSLIVCWRFLELAKYLQIAAFELLPIS